jgi:DNA primase
MSWQAQDVAHARADRLLVAKSVPVMDVAQSAALLAGQAVRLRRAGAWWRGDCPLCGKSDKNASRFSANERTFTCFSCGAHGDGLALVQQARGVSFEEALELITSIRISSRVQALVAAVVAKPRQRAVAGRWLHDWRVAGLKSSDGVTSYGVRRWLESRGIEARLVQDVLRAGHVRFSDAFHVGRFGDGPDALWLRAPAMLLPMWRWDEGRWQLCGVHATYLADCFTAKAQLRDPVTGAALPARRMHGQAGVAMPLGLIDPAQMPAHLLVAEGFETALSAAQRIGLQGHGLIATLSLAQLQGGWLTDARGARSVTNPRPDPASPAFTLPDAQSVTIAVDADMAPITVVTRASARAAPEREQIGAAERAHVCAALAVQAWRKAGARHVVPIRPPLGMDFNDLAMEAWA